MADEVFTPPVNNATAKALRKRPKVTTPVRGESLTQTHQTDRANLPAMVRRLSAQGRLNELLEQAAQVKPVYADFSNVTDYHTAQQAIADAQQAFLGLPASIRDLFHNDPTKLHEALQNPDMAERLVQLGIIEHPEDAQASVKPAPQAPGPDPAPPPTEVPVVSPEGSQQP